MFEKIELLKESIATELRKLRADKNVSQSEIVNKINEKHNKNLINIGTLVRYEKGTVIQNLDKLVLILDYYQVDLKYFFTLVYENLYRKQNNNKSNKEGG